MLLDAGDDEQPAICGWDQSNSLINIGSSENESMGGMESGYGLPKVINPEALLEMAASILGQPVPEELSRGFERLHASTGPDDDDGDGGGAGQPV